MRLVMYVEKNGGPLPTGSRTVDIDPQDDEARIRGRADLAVEHLLSETSPLLPAEEPAKESGGGVATAVKKKVARATKRSKH